MADAFPAAVAYVQNAPKDSSLSNADKLLFYGLYKQSTAGKCNTKKPSRLNVVAYAKVRFGGNFRLLGSILCYI